jgi:hypothetical protein
MPMPCRSIRLTPGLAAALVTLTLACTRQSASSPSAEGPAPTAKDEPIPAAKVEPAPLPAVDPEPSREVIGEPFDPVAYAMARRLREASTPLELTERGAAANVWDDYWIDYGINPFYLRGDFDGDARPDYLVSVLRKHDPESPPNPRLLVLRGTPGKDAAVWLDDDEQLSTPARDGWYVHAKRTKVPEGFDGTKAPKLQGDAIVMMKLESSMALVYWNGKRFLSHWLSD